MNRRLFRIGYRITVTMMLCRASAAQVSGRAGRLQRRRNKNSGNREQQQTSRDQALHIFQKIAPRLVSIDDRHPWGKAASLLHQHVTSPVREHNQQVH